MQTLENSAPPCRIVTFTGELPENPAEVLKACGCPLFLKYEDLYCVFLEQEEELVQRHLPEGAVMQTADELQPDSTTTDENRNLVIQGIKIG